MVRAYISSQTGYTSTTFPVQEGLLQKIKHSVS